MTDWAFDWDGDWHHDWFRFTDGPPAGGPPLDGYGDGGVATLVLDLENGYTVTHEWSTNIIKARAGNEQRIARNRIRRESYSGEAILLGTRPRELRATLAQYAAAGSVFLLAMPHHAISLRDDASGTTVPVFGGELSTVDWAKPGQRVVCVHLDADDLPVAVDAVVQSTTADTIELDVSPGTPYGGWIMPVRHVYLEPQQDFPRYPHEVESWQLKARAAKPLDYAPTLASIALGPLCVSASLDDAIVYSRLFGLQGNTITFALDGDPAYPATGQLVEVIFGTPLTIFRFQPGVTTFQNMLDALASSAYVIVTGVTNPTATMQAGDEMGDALTGAEDAGDVGTGATLTEYAGDGTTRPVWSREINVEGTIPDGVHAMTKIIDKGGTPYSLPTADQADWYRTVAIASGTHAEEQWFDLFMATVLGNTEKFWLATWRDDLEYVSHVGASLVIDDADFTPWWPSKREHVQIEQDDGTVTRTKITAAVNNGDGTRTLTLADALSAEVVTRISWLELCRFENGDKYSVVHDETGFHVSLVARVVP